MSAFGTWHIYISYLPRYLLVVFILELLLVSLGDSVAVSVGQWVEEERPWDRNIIFYLYPYDGILLLLYYQIIIPCNMYECDISYPETHFEFSFLK